MPRLDTISGSIIGDGEDPVFDILKNMIGLEQKYSKNFPDVGIYRQLSVGLIYDNEQMKFLADFHKKSSIDIFIIPYVDDYTPHLSRLAIRIEGKKGDLKMLRQGVQKNLLLKWCKVVDVHKRNCPNLFKNKINPKAIEELKNAFLESNVKFPELTI